MSASERGERPRQSRDGADHEAEDFSFCSEAKGRLRRIVI